MAFFSKVWGAVKGAARQIGGIIGEIGGRLIRLPDLLFGFTGWWKKKLRIKILILTDQDDAAAMSPADLTASIEYAKRVFKDRFNVELLPYPGTEVAIVDILTTPAPGSALNVSCGTSSWGEEFGGAGQFFADHLVGLVFPITVFVVSGIDNADGCSLGPLTDYITIDPEGVRSINPLAHELGHACGLTHWNNRSNLMWSSPDRGDGVEWWQKNLFRSSRHVTYW